MGGAFAHQKLLQRDRRCVAAILLKRMCSVETYSSFRRCASSKARSRTSFEDLLQILFGEHPKISAGARSASSTSPASAAGGTPKFFEQGRHNTISLSQKSPEQMQRLNLLLARAATHLLGGLQGFLGLYCEFVKSQHSGIFSFSVLIHKGASHVSRPLAVSCRVLDVSVCDVHLHLLWLRLSPFRQLHSQNAVLVISLDGLGVHRAR